MINKISVEFKNELKLQVPQLFEPVYIDSIKNIDLQKYFRKFVYCLSTFNLIEGRTHQTLTMPTLLKIFGLTIPDNNKQYRVYHEIIAKFKEFFPKFQIEKIFVEELGHLVWCVVDKGFDYSDFIKTSLVSTSELEHKPVLELNTMQPVTKEEKKQDNQQKSDELAKDYELAQVLYGYCWNEQKAVCQCINNNSEDLFFNLIDDDNLVPFIKQHSKKVEYDLGIAYLIRSHETYQPIYKPSVKIKVDTKTEEGLDVLIDALNESRANSTRYRSSRIYPKGASVVAFSADFRKKLFENYSTSDIKSSQLIMAAHYLKIDSIKTFLKLNKSVWAEITEYLKVDLDAETKQKIKDGLYACLYGASKKTIKAALGPYLEKAINHFIFKDLLLAQKEWTNSNKGKQIKDLCFETKGYWLDAANSRSVLSIIFQNVELYILSKIAEYKKHDKDFKLLFTLHDSITYDTKDAVHEAFIIEKLDKIILKTQKELFGYDIGLRFEHEKAVK